MWQMFFEELAYFVFGCLSIVFLFLFAWLVFRDSLQQFRAWMEQMRADTSSEKEEETRDAPFSCSIKELARAADVGDKNAISLLREVCLSSKIDPAFYLSWTSLVQECFLNPEKEDQELGIAENASSAINRPVADESPVYSLLDMQSLELKKVGTINTVNATLVFDPWKEAIESFMHPDDNTSEEDEEEDEEEWDPSRWRKEETGWNTKNTQHLRINGKKYLYSPWEDLRVPSSVKSIPKDVPTFFFDDVFSILKHNDEQEKPFEYDGLTPLHIYHTYSAGKVMPFIMTTVPRFLVVFQGVDRCCCVCLRSLLREDLETALRYHREQVKGMILVGVYELARSPIAVEVISDGGVCSVAGFVFPSEEELENPSVVAEEQRL